VTEHIVRTENQLDAPDLIKAPGPGHVNGRPTGQGDPLAGRGMTVLLGPRPGPIGEAELPSAYPWPGPGRWVRAERYRPQQPARELRVEREARGRKPAPTIIIVSRSLDLPWQEDVFRGSLVPPLVVTAHCWESAN
jgi:hypothetical protein